MVREMHRKAFEAVRDHRAGRASRLEVGSKHEVIDQQLGTAAEQVLERGGARVGLEAVLLIYAYPGQGLALLRQFDAAAREFLLRLEELESRVEPLLTCSGLVGHRMSPWLIA